MQKIGGVNMAGKNVETNALGQAAAALGSYITDVQNNIQKMKDAAQDCSDNMGNDAYSRRAILRLSDCAKELQRTLAEAESLQKVILAKKRQIEDSLNDF